MLGDWDSTRFIAGEASAVLKREDMDFGVEGELSSFLETLLRGVKKQCSLPLSDSLPVERPHLLGVFSVLGTLSSEASLAGEMKRHSEPFHSGGVACTWEKSVFGRKLLFGVVLDWAHCTAAFFSGSGVSDLRGV